MCIFLYIYSIPRRDGREEYLWDGRVCMGWTSMYGMDGFKIDGTYTVINNLKYADNTVIISESEDHLHELMDFGDCKK